MLAVKPHLFSVVVKDLKNSKAPSANQLVLSVMSGITIADIEKVFKYRNTQIMDWHQKLRRWIYLLKGLFGKVQNLKAVIRVMPNTPALVGAGCAGMCQSIEIPSSDANGIF